MWWPRSVAADSAHRVRCRAQRPHRLFCPPNERHGRQDGLSWSHRRPYRSPNVRGLPSCGAHHRDTEPPSRHLPLSRQWRCVGRRVSGCGADVCHNGGRQESGRSLCGKPSCRFELPQRKRPKPRAETQKWPRQPIGDRWRDQLNDRRDWRARDPHSTRVTARRRRIALAPHGLLDCPRAV